jgi:hypothetical protein
VLPHHWLDLGSSVSQIAPLLQSRLSAMTTAVDCGADRLRDIRGECCDLCGDVCHPDAEVSGYNDKLVYLVCRRAAFRSGSLM